MMPEPNNKKQTLTRRDALKTLAAVTGAVTLSSLPRNWQTSVVEVGALPAHAQTSPFGAAGSLSVTAAWSPAGHVDMVVIEPTGEFVHPHFDGATGPTVRHGGVSNSNENASIPAGGAAAGIYEILVGNYTFFTNNGETVDVTVTITTEACTYTFSQTIDPAEAWLVAEITYPGGTVTENGSTGPAPALGASGSEHR